MYIYTGDPCSYFAFFELIRQQKSQMEQLPLDMFWLWWRSPHHLFIIIKSIWFLKVFWINIICWKFTSVYSHTEKLKICVSLLFHRYLEGIVVESFLISMPNFPITFSTEPWISALISARMMLTLLFLSLYMWSLWLLLIFCSLVRILRRYLNIVAWQLEVPICLRRVTAYGFHLLSNRFDVSVLYILLRSAIQLHYFPI